MSSPQPEHTNNQTSVVIETETDRLRRDVYRSDMEKFLLFTQMLRTNKMYSRIKVTHK
jgi:hypothetical protein